MFHSFVFLFIDSKTIYTVIFVNFQIDKTHRNVFYIDIFVNRKISLKQNVLFSVYA